MTTADSARNQAILQIQYIERLLSACRMDWDTYLELKDCDPSDLDEDDLKTLQELTEQAADCESLREAREQPA